jgi:hypothetical protein
MNLGSTLSTTFSTARPLDGSPLNSSGAPISVVYRNGAVPLVPQAHEYVLHFSNYLLAAGLVRDRDFVLGWIDDDTWGVLHQAAPYDPQDAQALHIGPDDDLSSTDDFDVQDIIASGQVLNICRSSDPPDTKPFCPSDDKPPLRVNWAQLMTLRAALDTRENARAQQGG